MIHIQNVTRTFVTETVETDALHEVSLDVEEGEFVALMGPSGCGKSTLLNILGLLDSPTEGSYYLAGEDVGSLSRTERVLARRGNIGFVFQSFHLIDELTVTENVELPLRYLGWKRPRRHERVAHILEQLDMAHRADHYPHQLSGGQQQRTAVARAVAAEPKLLVADEPTGNLDSRNGDDVMRILQGLHEGGTTIVMATHSQSQAAVAQRILRMFDGEVVGDERQVTTGNG
jgi:putative ABC transport system ATP-binding protein